MSKRKKLYIASMAIVIFYGIYLFISHGYGDDFGEKTKLWKYLTLWDFGLEGIFFIVVLLGSMYGVVLERYKEFYYRFVKNCQVRIGIQKYIFKQVKGIFFETVVFMAIVHICLLMFCFFYFKEPLLDSYNDYCYLSQNQILNIVLFIVLSCLGTAIVNLLFYSSSVYMTNLYVYIVLPIIWLFASMIISDCFVQLFGSFLDFTMMRTVFLSIVPAALIQPGNLDGYGLGNYFCALVLYVMIIVIQLIIMIRKSENE